MSESKHNYTPYRSLGFRLRRLREKRNQSLAEVSGAVEIDADVLEQIESGAERPSEDILMLLISHLDPQEEEAVRLWELAGYDQPNNEDADEATPSTKPIIMLLQQDTRVLYSDMVNVVVSQEGVVLNFLQSHGASKPNPVSRVGMSREQAERVLQALQHSLRQQPPQMKALPAPKPDKD